MPSFRDAEFGLGASDPAAPRPRGRDDHPGRGALWTVGLGPGGDGHLTPAAREAIAEADVVMGHRPYLELCADLLQGKEVRPSSMMREVERVREALDLARAGRRVALVSSGDAGVYGMGGLALELAEEGDDVRVVPGVTAALAAASILGAPLANDFAVASLSDLLTPLPVILKRVEAAALGDLVLVLYNPRSHRRVEPLDRALGILRAHRAPDTPVGAVRHALRPGQEAWISALADFDPGRVDMNTVLVVGSQQTMVRNGRLVTRRGYRGVA